MLLLAGVRAIDTSVAAVTPSEVVPEMASSVALMFVVPTPCAVAKPLVPPAVLICATDCAEEAQVTTDVRS